MARMRETRESGGGLLGTAAGKKETPAAETEETLRMPDPFDPVKREVERAGLRLARLRGGRLATILSPLLRNRLGIGRTANTDSTTTSE